MQRLELKDFLDYTSFSEPMMSPDGYKTAFVRHVMDEEKNGYISDVMFFNHLTEKIEQVTSLGNSRRPFFLKNNALLYESTKDVNYREKTEKGETWTVYISAETGEEYFSIPVKVNDIWELPDHIFLLQAEYNLAYPELHTWDTPEKAEALRRKKENQDYIVADELPFRRDGLGITNDIRIRLALFDPKENNLIWITPSYANVENVALGDQEIAYTAHHHLKEKPLRYPTGIYVYSLIDGTTKQLTPESLYRIRCIGYFDQDIVFAGSDLKRYGNQENPWFYRIKDGKIELLAKNEESAMNSVVTDCRYGGGATWAVFDNKIYFLSTVGGHVVLKEVDEEGTICELSERNGTIDSFCVGQGGIVCVAMKNYRLQEMYWIKDGQETRLTQANDWVINERTLSIPESIAFESTYCTLEGFVIKPVNFDPNKMYPAILDIHGGHKCAYGPIFYHEMQLWANKGYFVFFCNPRGSDGGGNEFAEIIGRYGEIDYVDIMAFTDEVLARYPAIDNNRLGVTGGSYGGYMTNWVIGHTDRFRCAASQRSIASYVSMFCTSDTGITFPMYSFQSSLWENPERYWSHSPLKYADKVTTPTLFIHSENDYRCPVSEGIQMFTALKFYGVEARLCIFKEEGHELSRGGKPKHRVRRLEEITNWFEKHLKYDN